MNIFLYLFAPENLVSRDRFGRPVPSRVRPLILHSHQSSIINLFNLFNLVLTHGITPDFRGVYVFIVCIYGICSTWNDYVNR